MRLRGLPSRLAAGALGVYALYYASYGLLPGPVARGRVVVYLVNSKPLLGLPQLDLIVLAGLLAYAASRRRGGPALLGLLLAFAGYTIYTLTMRPWALALYSPAAALGLAAYRGRGLGWVASSTALAASLVEALGLAGGLSYFALGRWAGPAWALVVRERLLWAALTWVLAPLAVIVGLAALAAILLGRPGIHESLRRLLLGGRAPPGRVGRLGSPGGECGWCPWSVVASAGLAAFLVALPHLPTVNPGGAWVSVDTRYYMGFLSLARSQGLRAGLEAYSGMARPAYLALLYLAAGLVDPRILVDVIHPIAALTLLAAASYVAVSRLAGPRAGALAALLAASGRTAATFIIGGFQANSIALPLALLMLAAPPGSLALPVLAALVALVHPWTYVMYAAAYPLAHRRSLKEPGRLAALLALLVGALLLAEAAQRLAAPGASAVGPVASSLEPLALKPEPAPLNVFHALTLWTWGSQDQAPLLLAGLLAPPGPLWAPLAASSPLLLALPAMLAHRILLNAPIEQLAAIQAGESRDPAIKAFLLLAALAGSTIALAGIASFG
ncbi:MAG: hypothetical protein GSR80_000995 [Desulfurococcales archaeon]|nr:hypothetical protein [Desulfurococcales archaeon]